MIRAQIRLLVAGVGLVAGALILAAWSPGDPPALPVAYCMTDCSTAKMGATL